MKWINVKEESPKGHGFYNVEIETEEGSQTHSMWFTDGQWYYDSTMWSSDESISSTSFYAEVTHWMPLPEPPKN